MIVQTKEGPPGKKISLFHYEKSRSKSTIAPYLLGYKACLVSDGLEVYASLNKEMSDISHGGFWAHARRKFTEAIKGKRAASTATEFIELIKALFVIEKKLAGKDLDEIKKVRKIESKAVINELDKLLSKKLLSVPKKSLTGKALHYLKNQWLKLYFVYRKASFANS